MFQAVIFEVICPCLICTNTSYKSRSIFVDILYVLVYVGHGHTTIFHFHIFQKEKIAVKVDRVNTGTYMDMKKKWLR